MAKKKSNPRKALLVRAQTFGRNPLLVGLLGLVVATGLYFIYQAHAYPNTNWSTWAPRIRYCESSNNYTVIGPTVQTGNRVSGAWQILRTTWNHYGGYNEAYQAPAQIQDAKAYNLFQSSGTAPWAASYSCWQTGGRANGRPQPDPPIYYPAGSTAPPPSANNARGYVDSYSCNNIYGWAYDPTSSSTSIGVHVYIDGPSSPSRVAFALSANISRPDVDQAYGIAGDHGFSSPFPNQYRDGQNHSLYIYAIGTAGNNALLGTGNTGTCAASAATPTPTPMPAPTSTVIKASTIEGYKMLEDGTTPSVLTNVTVQYVCCSSFASQSTNPFFFRNLPFGAHRVGLSSPPAGYSVVAIQCLNNGCVGSDINHTVGPGTYNCVPAGVCDANAGNSVVMNTNLGSATTIDLRFVLRSNSSATPTPTPAPVPYQTQGFCTPRQHRRGLC